MCNTTSRVRREQVRPRETIDRVRREHGRPRKTIDRVRREQARPHESATSIIARNRPYVTYPPVTDDTRVRVSLDGSWCSDASTRMDRRGVPSGDPEGMRGRVFESSNNKYAAKPLPQLLLAPIDLFICNLRLLYETTRRQHMGICVFGDVVLHFCFFSTHSHHHHHHFLSPLYRNEA